MDDSNLPAAPAHYDFDNLGRELKAVFSAFQIAFHNHICTKLFPVLVNSRDGPGIAVVPVEQAAGIARADPLQRLLSGIHLLADPGEISTFTHLSGYLARAVHAARQLKSDYDVGIGIAKKGMWTSFVFSLFGMEAYDILVYREGNHRLTCPMDRLRSGSLDGKRILVFDNDSVTGGSVAGLTEALMEKSSPKLIDLLLITRYSHLTPEYFQRIKDRLADGQFLGMTKQGRCVVDSFMSIGKPVRKRMALETDFRERRKDLQRLKVRLGA
ncbi:hypothetical protein GF318_03455 [Candidatus Micrarchaeota archaeon]|nr:hypothetical protein [Candidatus Micrarchaeota archaeon]